MRSGGWPRACSRAWRAASAVGCRVAGGSSLLKLSPALSLLVLGQLRRVSHEVRSPHYTNVYSYTQCTVRLCKPAKTDFEA
jgi:hypothetical protein